MSGPVGDGLGDEEAKPAAVGVKAVGREHEEDGRDALLEVGEAEVGARGDGGHAGRVEEVGVALS